MKIEITTHELTQLVADHAGLVARAEVAESQFRAIQADLAETQKQVPMGPLPIEPALELISKVLEALNSKNKIQAIKALRENLKCDLRQAKDAIESGMAFCDHCNFNGKQPINHVCKGSNALSFPSDSDTDSFARDARSSES